MKLKKLLSVILAVVMAVSMVSIGAFAAEGNKTAEVVGGEKYESLQAAIDAAANNQTVRILENLTVDEKVVIEKSITIEGNGKTLTYTGSDRAVDIPSGDVSVTILNLNVDCAASYCQRGINYNTSGKLNLSGVTVKGKNVSYALNLPGLSDNCKVEIKSCDLSGCIALNVWGEESVINVEDSKLQTIDKSDVEGYSAVKLNNDGVTAAEGTVVNIKGGSIIANDDSSATHNSTATGVIDISNETVVKTESGVSSVESKLIVTYAGSTDFYSCETLQDAIDIATDDPKATVKLTGNFEMTESVTVSGAVNLDLNGFTLSNEHKSSESYAMIYNNGALVIDDTSESKKGKISFKELGIGDPNAGWGSYTIRNNGSLTINNGIIENISEQNVGQQSMKHAYFAIMNYSGDLTINNGVISTPSYRSIDFWGGSLTVNGGEFVGQIWVRPLASHAVVDINSGEFTPCWMDGSSIYIATYDGKNNYKGAEVEISDGTFNGKVGCSTPSDIAGCITGGTFTEKAKNGTNSALIASGFEFSKDANGNYTVDEALVWITDTDAGWYSVEDKTEKFGLMRFLFHIDYEGEIAGSGIRYFSSNVTIENVTAGKGGVNGSEKAFFGDIINIPESAKGNTYYALAYINIGTESNPEYIWSGAAVCSPNFDKEFKDYTPLAGGNK